MEIEFWESKQSDRGACDLEVPSVCATASRKLQGESTREGGCRTEDQEKILQVRILGLPLHVTRMDD